MKQQTKENIIIRTGSILTLACLGLIGYGITKIEESNKMSTGYCYTEKKIQGNIHKVIDKKFKPFEPYLDFEIEFDINNVLIDNKGNFRPIFEDKYCTFIGKNEDWKNRINIIPTKENYSCIEKKHYFGNISYDINNKPYILQDNKLENNYNFNIYKFN